MRTPTVLLLLGAPLWAQDPGAFHRPYLGFTVARTGSEAPMQAGGPAVSFTTGSFAVFGGLHLDRTWGLEVEHAAYGNFPISDGITTWQRDLATDTLGAVAWVPLDRSATLLFKAGLTLWSASTGASGEGLLYGVGGGSSHGASVHFGAGLEYAFTRRWSARIEGSVMPKVLDARVTRIGGGLACRF